jgi:coproporphyrinogen III oxidase
MVEAYCSLKSILSAVSTKHIFSCAPLAPPPPNRDADKILAFSTDAVNHVVEAYCPIIKKHMNDPFTQEQKDWQQIRRGR